MIKKVFSHFGYYISLLLIFCAGFAGVYLNPSNRQLQMVFIMLTTFFYIFWGILHRLLNHDLSHKIVIEYVLIGSLGLSLVFFLMKAGLGI